ncbi:hypothetical protein JCM16303_001960 [Sporobolomyces ruberrimus]
MTSLDPTHIPGFERTSDPTTGQAVITSVSSSSSSRPTSDESQQQPSWKGAWKRRQEAKLAERLKSLDLDSEDEEDEESRKGDGKIPIPPIPDLRYEQGILSSLKPFLHSVTPSTTTTPTSGKGKEKRETEEHQEKLETVAKTVLASSQLTAQGDERHERKGDQSDALMGPLTIEWGMVSYVILRDQVVFPLLQGVLWGMAGIYLNGLWEWNRSRLAAKNLAQGARRTQGSGPGLLSRLGLSV